MSDVLVDMTALNTESRERGIGRYVRSLCGVLATREQWLAKYPSLPGASLTISGLTRHRGKLEGAEDPSLTFAGNHDIETKGLHYQRHKLERRLFMGGLLKRAGSRLVHLPDPPGTPIDRRQPRIVTCHDLIPLMLGEPYLLPVPGARALQRARDKARYKTALRVIAISEATRRDLVSELGIAPERIDVVHHGVDHERFNPSSEDDERARLEQALGLDAPFLLYMGAGDARKNLPLLVRSYARSRARGQVRLVLAGPLSKRQRQRLAGVIGECGVEPHVKLLGYVEEAWLAPLYRHCRAHVFPSSYEGFGLTLLEGMACGAPTLTTAFSSLGEVAGDAALTLRELAEEPFVAALERLVFDEALQVDLRQRGIAHARTFTWERCAAQTLGCYQRALDQLAAS
jgi:glycosyltransferase involved in cell wall biosynthesis